MMSAQNARVALVTGASSGIGEAAVARLLAQGFIVYAGARRVDRMSGIEQRGAHTLALDVTDDANMTTVVEQILAERNRIDVLVNNAGYGSYGSIEEVPLEEARRQFEVNVFGLARLTQLVLPAMRERRSGRIINVSSIGGRIYEPLGAWYHATKFALEGLSDSLRLEVSPFGIDVTIIQPGPIRTEWSTIALDSMTAVSGEGPYSDIAQRIRATYERFDDGRAVGTPEQVAEAIVRAATARKPKTREAVPTSAKTVVVARRLLSDRAMDRVMKRVLTGG
jgi:short-subunit dehydrogenase